MDLAEFNKRFRIVPTSLFGLPRDLSGVPMGQPVTGDCQDYAKTVARIEGVRFPKAIMIRCWSRQNGLLPRHAVMWIKGKGFIDSTVRKYRKTPLPHIPVWPVGTPAILALAYVAKLWGWW